MSADLEMTRLAESAAESRYDVCIIGSGFVGTVVGTSLATRGVRTVILESGRGVLRWFSDRRIKALAEYEVSGDCAYPTERTKARALGGNSNFWTGRCERYHPSDFERHAYTPADNPWPLGYDDLEPYYQRAEETLRVRGSDLSRYTPPRSAELPLRSGSSAAPLKSLLGRAGATLDDSPTATPRRALRFFRLQKELLAPYRNAPSADLKQGLTVTRLLPGRDRSIEGAEARALDGSTRIIRARLFLLGCGGIETPRLLLLSRSEAFPEGIGNRSGRVGRGFNEHAGVNFYAQIPHSRTTLDPRHKLARTHQFYDDFREDGLGSVFPVFIQSWLFPNHLMRLQPGDLPATAVRLLRQTFRPTLYIGATIEMEPDGANRVTLSKSRKDVFGNPLAHLHFSFTENDHRTLARTRELIRSLFARLGATHLKEAELTWSRHHIGTCRMGDDPRTSVCDRNLRVHESPNLYLCGAETFVTGAAVPPVLTIVALAHRLSDHLLDRLRQDGDR
jgi:choline dehydrogenase-like flavoprotein